MERERVIEIFLGLILIVLMFIMILLIISISEEDEIGEASTTTISNSYNTHTYYNQDEYGYEKDYTKTKEAHLDYGYYKKDYGEYDYPDYISAKNYRKYEGFFGNDIYEYTVYVKNKDYDGGYFTVNFYVTDYFGKTNTESLTYYIYPKEEKKFVYKDVYTDGKKYKSWNYKVIPETKIQKRYYDKKAYYFG
ncbi:hypothetical protein J4407_03350 [Candidatus Pacearchaeota archaeon]|nr:hypothetical protein [Candidatus Pacearchaeota archaeon]